MRSRGNYGIDTSCRCLSYREGDPGYNYRAAAGNCIGIEGISENDRTAARAAGSRRNRDPACAGRSAPRAALASCYRYSREAVGCRNAKAGRIERIGAGRAELGNPIRQSRHCQSSATRHRIGVWGNGEMALPGDPVGELEVVDGFPDGGKIHQLTGVPSAFTPDYAPQEMFEIATKLYQASR